MTDSKRTRERIGGYVRGELNAADARVLAQESLIDQDLFSELTYSALAKAAVATPPAATPGRPSWRVVAVAGIAAALLITFVSLRSFSRFKPPPQRRALSLQPALSSSAKPGQAILLASALEPSAAPADHTPVFRGSATDSRQPKSTGSISSVEQGVAALDLGALDGLAKGSEVEVSRDGHPVGRVVVSAVFRERSRGEIAGEQGVKVGDQARVPSGEYLSALMAQIDAASSSGDAAAARLWAEKAVESAQSRNVPSNQQRKAFERAAQLEYEAGAFPAAEQNLRLAAGRLNASPQADSWEQSGVLNGLAAILLMRGDTSGAQALLRPGADSVQSLNDLGVLEELRGEPKRAEKFYTDALRSASGYDRQAVEANLSRLRASH